MTSVQKIKQKLYNAEIRGVYGEKKEKKKRQMS